MENNRNLFITIAASVLILTLWQVFYMNPRIEAERKAAEIEAARVEEQKKDPARESGRRRSTPAPGGTVPADVPGSEGAAAATREAAIAATQRVKIDTPSISGSINLTGGRIDDVKLKHYRLTVDKDSPEIELLNPSALPNGQYAELGFVGSEATGAVPGPETVWKAEGNQTLTPSTPVTLSYINPTGLAFTRTISIDRDYMFKVSDTVKNTGAGPVSLSNYGRVTRFDKPTTASVYVLHEGLIGVTGEEGLHRAQIFGDRRGQAGDAVEIDGRLAGHHRQILGRRAGAAGQAAVPAALRLFRGRPAALPVRLPVGFLHRRAGAVADRGDAGVRRRQGGRQDQRL